MRSQLCCAASLMVLGAFLSPGAQAQRQFEEWPVKHFLPSSPYSTRAVALADVDGDSDLDLVIARDSQHRLYLNRGTGTFIDVTSAQMPAG